MLSSDLDTKTVKWLRNSLEAAVEAEVKGNEVNLSNGSLLTARKKHTNSLSMAEGPSILLCLCCIKSICYSLYQPHQYACT